MNRKEVAQKYFDGDKRGAPAPCFCPDYTEDNRLYKEIGGLNEISVAQSKHSLSSIVNVRLQEVPVSKNLQVGDDNLIFDSITPKSMDVSELLSYAHQCEHDVIEQNKSD